MIKQGLWYQCKKSHPYFTEGNYYYSHSDDTLNDNRIPSVSRLDAIASMGVD